jgi:hypothetical protein
MGGVVNTAMWDQVSSCGSLLHYKENLIWKTLQRIKLLNVFDVQTKYNGAVQIFGLSEN